MWEVGVCFADIGRFVHSCILETRFKWFIIYDLFTCRSYPNVTGYFCCDFCHGMKLEVFFGVWDIKLTNVCMSICTSRIKFPLDNISSPSAIHLKFIQVRDHKRRAKFDYRLDHFFLFWRYSYWFSENNNFSGFRSITWAYHKQNMCNLYTGS